ncbi:MAG: MFS transporter [Planctomyces sp.]|nr:MFS transporter [Planctomyces sp.]
MTRYHWFVLMVAALGWLFDCLDQQLFILARPAVMQSFYPGDASNPEIKSARKAGADIATSIFIAGWATGGLFFGMLGDRIGRAKTMLITILLYSLFTGLSAISVGLWDFAFYRFLTGLGVGGEFAVGVALVAEVMPNNARPYTLGLLQALSAVGNVSAAMVNLSLGLAEEQGMPYSPWRIMFLVGAVPALLAVVVRRYLKEPEQWTAASTSDLKEKQLGSYVALFRHPVWRKHALLGLVLGFAGVVGLWSVGFYTFDLTREIQEKPIRAEVRKEFEAKYDPAILTRAIDPKRDQKADPLNEQEAEISRLFSATVNGRISRWPSYTSIMFNVGAFFGMFGFGALSQQIGRKPTFAIAFISAFASTLFVFLFLTELWHIFVFVPIMGFCQLSLFSGYAIYFPELFPTWLRSTGTSFCYNVGRFVAAGGPIIKIGLDSMYAGTEHATRYTGATMCFVFLIGLFVLPFLPETKGKPLPE